MNEIEHLQFMEKINPNIFLTKAEMEQKDIIRVIQNSKNGLICNEISKLSCLSVYKVKKYLKQLVNRGILTKKVLKNVKTYEDKRE